THRAHARDFLQHVCGAHLKLALGLLREHRVTLVDPAVDRHFVPCRDDALLLLGIELRRHRRHEEGRPDGVLLEQLQNPRHALAGSILALREPADRLASFPQLVRLVVGVERERDRAARAAGPLLRLERPPGAHAVHDRAPALLRPLPGLFLIHFLLILRATLLISSDCLATNLANSAGGMPTASSPWASNCLPTSGSASAFTVAAWRRPTSSGEAPAGSHRPNQLTMSKSRKPASCIVGTSGRPFQRFAPVSASTRTRPA